MDPIQAYRTIERYQKEQKLAGFAAQPRSLRLQPREKRVIDGGNSLWLLLYADDEVVVRSHLGSYDVLTEGIAELQEIHSGELEIENYSDDLKTVEFIQAVWF